MTTKTGNIIGSLVGIFLGAAFVICIYKIGVLQGNLDKKEYEFNYSEYYKEIHIKDSILRADALRFQDSMFYYDVMATYWRNKDSIEEQLQCIHRYIIYSDSFDYTNSRYIR